MACEHPTLAALSPDGRCPVCPNLIAAFAAHAWAPPPKMLKQDTWANAATGIGTATDKRMAGNMELRIVTATEARDLWRGNDLAARIIEAQPDDEFRRELELKMDDKEAAEKLLAALEEIPCSTFVGGRGAVAALIKARHLERATGGAAIFPVINDAVGSLAEPLNEKSLGKVERLNVYEARELSPSRYYDDVTDPKCGEVSHWRLQPLTASGREGGMFVEIHESRLIMFPGIRVTREDMPGAESGHGDNVLTRVFDVLNDFELSFGAAAHLIQDFSQAIIKLENLAEIVALDADDKAGARLAEMNRWRSVLHAIVLDNKDTFERHTTNLSGLPEMFDRFIFRLAAAARMPVTKLMGMAPGGLNATGESDNENWDEEVSKGQKHSKPMVERLVYLFMLSADSPTGGKEPATWSVGFKPLKEPDEKADAEAREIQMRIDVGYIDAQVYSPEEVAHARFGGDTYSFATVIDFKARERFEKMAASPVAVEGEDPEETKAKAAEALTAAKPAAKDDEAPADDDEEPEVE